MLKQKKYKCSFCNRDFKRKSWFDRHLCDKKKRFLDSNNITVIRAHRLFNHWQRRARLLRKGAEKSIEDFCKSPYYNTFVRLAEFTTTEYVVTGFKYVDWLVDNEIPEARWCNERDLDQYRAYVRESEDPESQADTTVKNIRVWCDDHGVEKTQFFRRISPGQALNMVRENKLSPWVLLGYDPCIEDLTSRFQGEILFALNDHINVKYWLEKTQQDDEGRGKVSALLDERLNAT